MYHAIGSLTPEASNVGNLLRKASYVGTLLAMITSAAPLTIETGSSPKNRTRNHSFYPSLIDIQSEIPNARAPFSPPDSLDCDI